MLRGCAPVIDRNVLGAIYEMTSRHDALENLRILPASPHASHCNTARFCGPLTRHSADTGTEHDLPHLALDHASPSGRPRVAPRSRAPVCTLHGAPAVRLRGAVVHRV